ncbi:hypothetical protein SNOG_05465 [Parastagonospora nodorum SN15]|uniref:Uncharacterized protein n=1 Tax=Phaeosphaeria nodorum (strain SN15 / ATCC MYA-4574 / FGSC 10173) TaxID=321614 RepID=Q0URZ9_PHANO|nr:hypothetical protein SNOG_05465 [Parastagonospora nodorum SN15]EAT86529.1 hypothetical protein SNOG_05465 [Parastagonospora nodorum SN15]
MANITAHWVSVRNDAEDMYHCYRRQGAKRTNLSKLQAGQLFADLRCIHLQLQTGNATETSYPVVEEMHEPENSVCFCITDRPPPSCALTPNIQTRLFVTSLACDKPGSGVPATRSKASMHRPTPQHEGTSDRRGRTSSQLSFTCSMMKEILVTRKSLTFAKIQYRKLSAASPLDIPTMTEDIVIIWNSKTSYLSSSTAWTAHASQTATSNCGAPCRTPDEHKSTQF